MDRVPSANSTSLELSPISRLLVVATLAFLIFFIQTWHFTNVPWLGAEFSLSTTGDGLDIAGFNRNGPNANQPPIESTIVGLNIDGELIPLSALTLIEEPDTLEERSTYLDLLHQQDKIYNVLQRDTVQFILSDASRLELTTGSRPFTSIPLVYFSQQLFGLLGLFIGAAVWTFNRRSTAARLLFITGIGFYLACIGAAYYSSRELALAAETFRFWGTVNRLGTQLFAAAFVLLLWHYPTQLGQRRLILPVFSLFLSVWLIDTLNLTASQGSLIYTPVMLAFVTSIFFAVIQWRRSSTSPADRAALKWFLLSIYLGTGFFAITAALPVMLGSIPLADQSLLLGTFLLMYTGLAFGVARFRLFDLDRWWLRAWVWFLSGILLILIDFTILYIAKTNQWLSLSISILVVGWLYFPIRQFIIGRFSIDPSTEQLYLDPHFIQDIVAIKSQSELNTLWFSLLQHFFQPSSVEIVTTPSSEAVISKNGEELMVPSLQGDNSLKLRFRAHGRKLFSSGNVSFCNHLHHLLAMASNSIVAREQGALTERSRIGRDLHDDLGAKLLTLIHNASSTSQKLLANEAMQELRETLNNLDEKTMSSLELFGRIRTEIDDRLNKAGVALDWHDNVDVMDNRLSARFSTNLIRIIRELTTNALKHAQPNLMAIEIKQYSERFKITLQHDGLNHDAIPETWQEGRGWSSIRTRLAELGGTIDKKFGTKHQLSITLNIPTT